MANSFSKLTNSKKGEIATTLTLITIGLMTLGIFAGSKLAQQDTNLGSRAQENGCVLNSEPTLVDTGEGSFACRFTATAVDDTLVCALIEPHGEEPDDDVLAAGQDPSWNGSWEENTVTIPMYLKEGITLSASTEYRLVAYDWTDAANCVKEKNYAGTTVVGLYGGSSAQPTPTPTTSQAQPTNTPTPEIICDEPPINGECTMQSSCLTPNVRILPSDYGCRQLNTSYICCAPKDTTPPPTNTPTSTPAAPPTEAPTATPTPTSTPQAARANEACNTIESVRLGTASPTLGKDFNCIIKLKNGALEENNVCGVRKASRTDEPPDICENGTSTVNNNRITVKCNTKRNNPGRYYNALETYQLVAYRFTESCGVSDAVTSFAFSFQKEEPTSAVVSLNSNLSVQNMQLHGNFVLYEDTNGETFAVPVSAADYKEYLFAEVL